MIGTIQSTSGAFCGCSKCTLLHHCLCQPSVGLKTANLSPGPILQDAVSSGGPLLAILAFCILPLVWSVPEALITAELATAFPENSGYVAWVTAAFGPFWGFQVRCLFGCKSASARTAWGLLNQSWGRGKAPNTAMYTCSICR